MRRAVLFILAIGIFYLPAGLHAQSTSASVTGIVTDPSKATIDGAKVVVINDGTGLRYENLTNHTGSYYISNLPPGTYRVEVEKTGFRTVLKPGVVLHLQDAVEINFEMSLGSVSETVTVSAGAPIVNTQDASVSTVVDQTYIANMPLNGRSFQDLILLTPGVVTQTPQFGGACSSGTCLGRQGEFSVGGQRTEENYYTVDGVSANVGATSGSDNLTFASGSGSVAGATALGTTQALVSVDDLQEFRVQSSSYSAEYGRNPGGQFAFETKSGNNQWHGSAYDYLRNGFLDAQDWFNDYYGTPEAALHQNDFGGTLGGPITIPRLYSGKDKTFVFVSYEGLRLSAPQAATANLVPDAALRASAPAALQPVLNAFPLPTPGAPDDGMGIGTFIGTWVNPGSIDSTSVRFDHVIKDKSRLFFRFSNTTSNTASRGTTFFSSTPSVNMILDSTVRTYTAGITSLISSRLSNDFRLNYTSNTTNTNERIDPIAGSMPVDIEALSGLGGGSAANVCLFWDGNVCIFQLPASGAQRQWNLADTVSFSVRNHQLKFGADYRRLTPYGISPSPFVFYWYFSPSSVQNNSVDLGGVTVQNSGYPLYTNFSAFAEDEWRVLPRLNLSFGLRWEVNPAPGVTKGIKPYTLQGSSFETLNFAPEGTPLWKTTWFNFAPRLGMAYTVRGSQGSETVLRAGGGVFFDTGQQDGGLGFLGPGFGSDNDFSGLAFPVSAPAFIIPIQQNPPKGFGNLTAFHPHLQLPYTLHWNASIQQALGKSQALTISYVGSHGARLLATNSFSVNNPNFTFFSIVQNGLTSDYNSLQVQLQRRLSKGLTALGSYTWSHCSDYGSFNSFFGYNRGDCDVDVRHNFSAAFSYDVPNLGHGGFVDRVLHHWGIDQRLTARTAFPITLEGSSLFYPNGKLYNEGLSFVPGVPVYLSGAQCTAVFQNLGGLLPGHGCPGGKGLNPNAFQDVPSGLGDAPRNFARLFGAWQMDTAIRREFPIHERLKFQFRAEAFNIFNHPSFGYVFPWCFASAPNMPPCSSQFGLAQGTLASTLGVLSPLYQMGGPRSMQFALKLVF